MDVKNDLGGGKPTLLIAEDEESNYLLLKTILHKYCNLIRAKTGLEALALFKENEVDLILMDIKMPEMTGSNCKTESFTTDKLPDYLKINDMHASLSNRTGLDKS